MLPEGPFCVLVCVAVHASLGLNRVHVDPSGPLPESMHPAAPWATTAVSDTFHCCPWGQGLLSYSPGSKFCSKSIHDHESVPINTGLHTNIGGPCPDITQIHTSIISGQLNHGLAIFSVVPSSVSKSRI